MSSLHFLKISLLFPKLQGETGSDWTASSANQSRLSLRIPAGRTNRAFRAILGVLHPSPFTECRRSTRISAPVSRACFRLTVFAVAARRGALARIAFVAIANVTHPVLAPVATEEESAAGWNDRPRIAALSTCQWQTNARRSFLVLHDAVDAPAAIVHLGLDGEAALLLERARDCTAYRVRLPSWCVGGASRSSCDRP